MNIVKLSITSIATYLMMLQPTMFRTCTCQDFYSFSDSSFASIGASYQVPARSGCCSGTASGVGHFSEVYTSSSGAIELIDYCQTTGAAAQAFCC